MLKIYSDAAVNGNPGRAGIGIVISGSDLYEQLKKPLEGDWDNHSAEFEAICQAIEWVVDQGLTDSLTLFFTDSQVVAKSLEKKYVRNDLFKPYLDRCLSLLNQLAFYEVRWIPEKQNKGADNLAKQALQASLL